MEKREFKDRLYEQLAAIPKALSNPVRLELLELVAQCERTVEWLSNTTGQSFANTSQHLQVLRRARLVEARRDGNHVLYRLSTDAVWDLVVAIRRVAHEQNAEMDRVVSDFLQSEVVALSSEALLARMQAEQVVLLDVRPREEFVAGHLPGARSVPLDELPQALAQLPHDRDVIAYCRGPYCVFADDAVRTLRTAGRVAHRLELGLPEWRAAGLPVVTGEA
jgi:rhodanese-related sulfurtransferase/DNA-binding transcriptional ArsR family regulator